MAPGRGRQHRASYVPTTSDAIVFDAVVRRSRPASADVSRLLSGNAARQSLVSEMSSSASKASPSGSSRFLGLLRRKASKDVVAGSAVAAGPSQVPALSAGEGSSRENALPSTQAPAILASYEGPDGPARLAQDVAAARPSLMDNTLSPTSMHNLLRQIRHSAELRAAVHEALPGVGWQSANMVYGFVMEHQTQYKVVKAAFAAAVRRHGVAGRSAEPESPTLGPSAVSEEQQDHEAVNRSPSSYPSIDTAVLQRLSMTSFLAIANLDTHPLPTRPAPESLSLSDEEPALEPCTTTASAGNTALAVCGPPSSPFHNDSSADDDDDSDDSDSDAASSLETPEQALTRLHKDILAHNRHRSIMDPAFIPPALNTPTTSSSSRPGPAGGGGGDRPSNASPPANEPTMRITVASYQSTARHTWVQHQLAAALIHGVRCGVVEKHHRTPDGLDWTPRVEVAFRAKLEDFADAAAQVEDLWSCIALVEEAGVMGLDMVVVDAAGEEVQSGRRGLGVEL